MRRMLMLGIFMLSNLLGFFNSTAAHAQEPLVQRVSFLEDRLEEIELWVEGIAEDLRDVFWYVFNDVVSELNRLDARDHEIEIQIEAMRADWSNWFWFLVEYIDSVNTYTLQLGESLGQLRLEFDSLEQWVEYIANDLSRVLWFVYADLVDAHNRVWARLDGIDLQMVDLWNTIEAIRVDLGNVFMFAYGNLVEALNLHWGRLEEQQKQIDEHESSLWLWGDTINNHPEVRICRFEMVDIESLFNENGIEIEYIPRQIDRDRGRMKWRLGIPFQNIEGIRGWQLRGFAFSIQIAIVDEDDVLTRLDIGQLIFGEAVLPTVDLHGSTFISPTDNGYAQVLDVITTRVPSWVFNAPELTTRLRLAATQFLWEHEDGQQCWLNTARIAHTVEVSIAL